MKFLDHPNLPEGDVIVAAVSGTYSQFADSLNQMSVNTIRVSPSLRKEQPLADHADLKILHAGSNRVFLSAGELTLKRELEKLNFHVMEIPYTASGPYPNDVRLNAVLIGNKMIMNPKTAAPQILDYCAEAHIMIIPVKQGYAKCTAAVIDKNSIITSDDGIARAAFGAGIEVLRIRPGYIRLDGYGYGFIGGTCGKIGKNTIAFCGKIQNHPDYLMIRDFLNARGIEPIALADCPLTDVGGILPLLST